VIGLKNLGLIAIPLAFFVNIAVSLATTRKGVGVVDGTEIASASTRQKTMWPASSG